MQFDNPSERQEQGIWIPESARRPAPEPVPEAPAPEAADTPTPAAESAAEAAEIVEAVDYHDKYLRALADADNQRKRAQEQQRLAVERANERFVLDLLPVLDAFERGLAAAGQEASVESLRQGMELMDAKLRSAAAAHGVEPIACQVGDPFNPELHEAMMRVPASETVAEGQIAAILESGYTLAGRVIRAVRVAVAAEPMDEEA